MIPKDYIAEWRDRAPWVLDRQVEQDLVISRALVELFSRAPIADALAFRGGTALYKLHLTPAARYSEDIDLVQTSPGGIGHVLDAIHDALDPWLGKPKWKQTEGRVTLNYRFESEDVPPVGLKLKVEINSREHFTAYGLEQHRFEVRSRWFTGTANLRTYELDELLGTKVTRAMFEQNLAGKKQDPIFTADMTPLLAHGHVWDFDDAFERVWTRLVVLLSGAPWKGG